MNELIIGIKDSNGQLISSQPFNEFMYGEKDLNILKLFKGKNLFNILFDDLGVIQYEDNKLTLKYILETNLYASSMKLLGKVAEAVIVRRCNENIEINKKWLSCARKKKANKTTAEKFKAYGTGLLSTKKDYPQKYNISEQHRDIIWINKENGKTALMNGSNSSSGTIAGLQVKVSGDGYNYFVKDLINKKYEVPLVYFDINNDYDSIFYYLMKEGSSLSYEDFIKASSIDSEAYQEVLFYKDLVQALINGFLSPDELLNKTDIVIRDDTLSTTFKNTIISTSLSEINIKNILI